MKFRVVYVIDSLRAGGAEVLLLTTIRHIDRTRFEPVVIALSSQSDLRPALEQAGAVVYNINLGRLIAPVGLLRLVRLLRRLRPHVVHTHLRLANVYGRFAAALAFTPVITTSFHHLDYSYWPPSTWASRIWYWIDKWSARLFNRGFIAVSAAVRADYAGHFGLSDITLLYNYIELEEFTSGQHAGKSAEIRKQFGWTEDEFVLIVVARLSWEKGQRVVLEALPEILKTCERARVLLVGEGPDQEELTRLADELGVASHVEFAGPRRDVPALLAAADAFVFPSLGEGLGIAVMEAMAAGKPVVVSNADGLRELVTEGADGLLTPPGDPRELAEAILRLTQDAKLRQRLGTSACQTAMERFGAESGVQALETAYDGWLGEQKGAVGANEF